MIGAGALGRKWLGLWRAARLALICALALGLLGCAKAAEYPGKLPESTATPPSITGGRLYTFEAELYFYSENNQRNDLRAEKRMLTLQPGESYAQAAVKALADGPESGELTAVMPPTLLFERVELTGNVCNVYFSGEFPERAGAIDYPLVLRAALAATVQSNQALAAAEHANSVWHVGVFINGIQQGYMGKPMGLLSPIEVALDTYMADIWQEYELKISTGRESPGYLEHNVALYFADTARELLIASVGAVNYSKGATGPQVVEKLVAELMKGPLSGDGLEWLIPADLRLRRSVFLPLTLPDTAVSQADEGMEAVPEAELGEPCIVSVYFEGPDDMPDAKLVYASLIYTITGFIPNVEGVIIYVNDVPVATAGAAGAQGGAGADIRRSYSHLIGQFARVFLPERGGRGLYPINRSLPEGSTYDPLARVRALFEGASDPGVRLDYFDSGDVLSVTQNENMAIVNFKEGFSEKLEDFIVSSSILPYDTRIRMFVFSLVNTLCELPGIQQVWMLENGGRIDESLGMIYLGGPLYYNPGLVLSDTYSANNA